jgi:protein-tyrosine phosphatase
MLFFRKRESEFADLGWLGTDIHSHLVPGIDDGSQDMATSLSLIRSLKELGYTRLVTTPHILADIYPNTPEIIQNGIRQVQSAVAAEKLNIDVQAAAEYFIDDRFEQNLQEKRPLLTIKDNLVLVEFSMLTLPIDLQQVLFELQMRNYQPLIAHPERYSYLNRNRAFYDELKDRGCLFQLNLLSLTGYYGSAVQELAAYLMKKEYYSYAGTDLHNDRHITALQKMGTNALYKRLKDSQLIMNHLL